MTQAEALALSDQIAVMHGGKLQQYGTPDEVYRRPTNKTVADFMGIVNFVPASAKRMASGSLGAHVAGVDIGVAVPQGVLEGDPLDVAVRPENVDLARSSDGRPGLTGTVTEETFLGNIVEYWVELSAGPTIRVQAHPTDRFSVGETVHAQIRADECSAFPRTEPTKQ